MGYSRDSTALETAAGARAGEVAARAYGGGDSGAANGMCSDARSPSKTADGPLRAGLSSGPTMSPRLSLGTSVGRSMPLRSVGLLLGVAAVSGRILPLWCAARPLVCAERPPPFARSQETWPLRVAARGRVASPACCWVHLRPTACDLWPVACGLWPVVYAPWPLRPGPGPGLGYMLCETQPSTAYALQPRA